MNSKIKWMILSAIWAVLGLHILLRAWTELFVNADMSLMCLIITCSIIISFTALGVLYVYAAYQMSKFPNEDDLIELETHSESYIFAVHIFATIIAGISYVLSMWFLEQITNVAVY